jgi:hypothetical protein
LGNGCGVYREHLLDAQQLEHQTMKRIISVLLGLFLGLGANVALGGYSTSGGGGAGAVTGGSCTNQAVTAIDSSGVPTCANVPESGITNLPTDLANLAALANTAAPGSQGSYVSQSGGCSPAWAGSGYVYNVPACTYWIGGVSYTSTATQLTLTAADATNDRFDAIVVNTSSAAAKVDGTAAANPTVPVVDPTTQLALTYVLVTHNTTDPVSATNEQIYDEDNDWTTTEGTGWDGADTGNPHAGTKDVKATAVTANNAMRFIRSSTLTLNAYQQLQFWVAPSSGTTWPSGRSLSITLRDANAAQVGAAITLTNGSFGFVRTSTTYQLIAIPLGLFNVPAGVSVKELRLNPVGTGGTFTFYVDDVALTSTTNTILPGGAPYATQYKAADGSSAGTGPGTSGYVLQSTGAATPPVYTIKNPIVWWMPVASCQNTTASLLWDSPTSNPAVAACVTGTNTQKGVADFDPSTDQSLQMTARLPADYNGGSIDARVVWLAAATSGSAGWCVQLIKVSDAATDDPAFPAQAAGTCTSDAAKGTTLQTNVATITGTTCTSCAAGDLLHIQLSRDANGGAVTDDMTGNGRVIGVELTVPRN